MTVSTKARELIVAALSDTPVEPAVTVHVGAFVLTNISWLAVMVTVSEAPFAPAAPALRALVGVNVKRMYVGATAAAYWLDGSPEVHASCDTGRGVYPTKLPLEAKSAVQVTVNVTGPLGFAANGFAVPGTHSIVSGFVACVGIAPSGSDSCVADAGATSNENMGVAPFCVAEHVAPQTAAVKIFALASICKLPVLYDFVGEKTNVNFVGARPSAY